jgi:hypothetical protein
VWGPRGVLLSEGEGCEHLLLAMRGLKREVLRVLGRALCRMQVIQHDNGADVVRCGCGQVYMAAGLYYLFDLEVDRYCSMPYVPTLSLPSPARVHTLQSARDMERRACLWAECCR